MSSILANFSQVGPREKYLLVTTAAAVGAGTTAAYTTTPLEASVMVSEFDAAKTGSALLLTQLYRDLGKTLTVYDPATNLETEKFVLAQLMSGASTEGVSSASVIKYIRVWAADSAKHVVVARIG